MKLFTVPKHLIDNKSKGGEKIEIDFGKEKTRSYRTAAIAKLQ